MQISNYLETDGRHFVQFNLWKNCNNNCDFCFNRGYKKSSIQQQIDILDFVEKELQTIEIDNYNEIGFIGGEFFDDQLDNAIVKEKFYHIINICAQKIKSRKLKKLYIATSLIFDINRHLTHFIKYLSQLDILDYVLFCTSYDIKYRFHTQHKLDLWENNMLKLHQLMPNNIVHTEIIVTQFFIDAVLNKKFDLQKFIAKYHTYVDFIEPTFIDYFANRQESIAALPDFFPRRQSFLDFVDKMCIKSHLIDINAFLSIKLRSDMSYYQLESLQWIKINNRWQNGIRRIDKHGNAKEIFSYVDSDKKMTDDIDIMRGIWV